MGMGGAFVAVADDASATWWNPAGLAGGPFFNLLIEHEARRREPASEISRLDRTAIDQTVSGVALGTPPLGLSYFRTRHTSLPALTPSDRREPDRDGDERGVSLVAHQTGVTLLHSLTAAFVVGSTLKFVRGIATVFDPRDLPESGSTDDTLEHAADLIGKATNRFDADLGVHFSSGPLRAGLTVRNLLEPSFAAPDGIEVTLERQARAGAAWVLRDALTIAVDLDLLEQRDAARGRRLAVGVEQRFNQRLALRGGLRLTASGSADAALAAGASYAVRPGIWMDGFWTRGEYHDTGWGVAGRVSY